jgi:hypothetical protein
MINIVAISSQQNTKDYCLKKIKKVIFINLYEYHA